MGRCVFSCDRDCRDRDCRDRDCRDRDCRDRDCRDRDCRDRDCRDRHCRDRGHDCWFLPMMIRSQANRTGEEMLKISKNYLTVIATSDWSQHTVV